MGRAIALGEEVRVAGFALAGARVVPAETPDAVRDAWAALDPDTALVLLTPSAAATLAEQLEVMDDDRLVVVLPS